MDNLWQINKKSGYLLENKVGILVNKKSWDNCLSFFCLFGVKTLK